jgi:hypothetical protein
VNGLFAAGLTPRACEFLDADACAAVRSRSPVPLGADVTGVLLVEVDGSPEGCAAELATVEQVCRAAGKEFSALPQPLDNNAAAEDQRRTAQILTTSVGKLNELQNEAGLPSSYLSWLAAYRQLPAINQRAAEAFAGSGLASGQAAQAGQEWEAQAEKANSLARDAGLDDCVLDDAQG